MAMNQGISLADLKVMLLFFYAERGADRIIYYGKYRCRYSLCDSKTLSPTRSGWSWVNRFFRLWLLLKGVWERKPG